MMKPLSRLTFTCGSCRRAASRIVPCRSYTRPSNAPKPAIDLRHIRQHPGLYEQNCIDRNYPTQSRHSWTILDDFQKWRSCQEEARALRTRQKQLRQLIASSDDVARVKLVEESRALKEQLSHIEKKEWELQDDMEQLSLALPNLTSHHTPSGSDFQILEYLNQHPDPSSTHGNWRSHVDIGNELSLLDFSSAATTTGWGWYYLLNDAALLEQALVQYALTTAAKRGWQIVSPPSVVYTHTAAACGFNPRDQNGEQQVYTLEQSAKDAERPPRALAGTAEIPLAAFKANQTLSLADLPLKVIGVSRSYRAEAGSRGVETKGLYRVHEFTKVEMFAWTSPDDPEQPSASDAMFAEMLDLQKEILTALGLHCRVLEMPASDLGASATRKQDIEAWFPSRRDKDEGWGEVTSASTCGDYQSRRLGTRVRLDRPGHDRQLSWPFTLNGTAVAVPRVLAALLENGWNEATQEVLIPEVLRPWMAGKEVIRKI